MPQIYDTGPTALFPFRRRSYSGFLRSEKIHRLRPGLNPRTSDPVASMTTTGPPGSTVGLGATLGYGRKIKKIYISLVSWIYPGRVDSVMLLEFECTINSQNLIKIVGAIFEKIKIFNFFLM